jgi:preprotein translocase subunit SecD
MRNTTISLILIAVLTALAVYIVLPVPHPDWLVRSDATSKPTSLELKLGLDLQGGTQVMLEADVPAGRELQAGAIDTARNIVERRVNSLGVSEAVVQAQGDTRVTAELPGVSNPDQAIETIRSTGQLEFVDPQGLNLQQGMIINTTNKPTAVQDFLAGPNADPTLTPYGEQLFTTAMTGDVLRTAITRQDQFGQWEIGFELTGEGNDQFFNYTSAHIGQPMAIILDGVVLSAPVINAAIRDQGVISGQFSEQEASSLAIQMRYGALPVPLKVVDVRSISATLGADSVSNSVIAGLIGMAAVFIFMVLMYRVPGLLANFALVIYVFFNLAIYKLIPVTLTLAGIAGFLLSVGMAVDANILIFERLKEELRSGRSPRLATEAGFSRAWPAIFDSNLTTLISCAVLYVFGNQFGASIVKGYALTLGLGVILSMFTAIIVTRTFMRVLLSNRSQHDKAAQTIVGY